MFYLLRRKMSTNGGNDRLVYLIQSTSRLNNTNPLNLNRIVAVASMLSTSDKQHNLAQVESIIEKAKKGNAKVSFRHIIWLG